MKLLYDAGLRGAHLFEVKTKKMVDRYNACLEHLGIEPTRLKTFSIDKVGWSPQIAKEKGDDHYLTHGLSNTVGVILSVEQENASLHFPYYSFEKSLMTKVFDSLKTTLMDVTTDTGVCLDIDNDISRFRSPYDLLLVEHYYVNFSTPIGIGEASKKQKELIVNFEDDDAAWQDPQARQELIDSVNNYGDLRRRKLSLHQVFFDETESFFTRNFGGVFIFRPSKSDTYMVMINEDQEDQIEAHPYDGISVFTLSDKKLLKVLRKADILTRDLRYWQGNKTNLERLKDDILVESIADFCPKNTDFITLTPTKKKALVRKYDEYIPEIYFEIENLLRLFAVGRGVSEVSPELDQLLLRPMRSATPSEKIVVQSFLSFINPHDVVQLYRFNKEKFYDDFATWPESRKRWAIWRIETHYKNKS